MPTAGEQLAATRHNQAAPLAAPLPATWLAVTATWLVVMATTALTQHASLFNSNRFP